MITELAEPTFEEKTAHVIVKKLSALGVKGIKIDSALVGPVVTAYPIQLSPSTPLEKILNKSENIALACQVSSVDIQRVDGNVVVFIPNKDRKTVEFKDVLYWYLQDEEVRNMTLPIMLGQDFEGNNAVLDLATQPHILIAGSTGSGKSLLESAIIAALATLKSPKELELYLVDTKRVDLGLFENWPHVKQTVKSAEDWYILINTIYLEVQKRNRLFEQQKVRNISEYNKFLPEDEIKLPYIVLIIDELADLMEKDNDIRIECKRNREEPETKVEDSLRKLIQICRAAGVHIIACTQRTSVDIISGTIKANFPTRISLRLPQSNDSRVILGQNGAENLLGLGDMLVKKSDSDQLLRYHGPYVELTDIEAIPAQYEMLRNSLGLIG